jgi:hypothetical protein
MKQLGFDESSHVDAILPLWGIPNKTTIGTCSLTWYSFLPLGIARA